MSANVQEEGVGVRRRGVKPGTPSPHAKHARNAAIAKRYSDGATLDEVAAAFAISKTRVRDILDWTDTPIRPRGPLSDAHRARIAAQNVVRARARQAVRLTQRATDAMGPLARAAASLSRDERLWRAVAAVEAGASYGKTAKRLKLTRSQVAGAVHRAKLLLKASAGPPA